MSSALSVATTVSYSRCTARTLYGLAAQRRSRNMAVVGLFAVMTLTMALCLALHAERTLNLPALQPHRVELVQPQFRFVSEQKADTSEVEKILTEESSFEIPEEMVPKAEPEPQTLPPEPEPVIKPEPQKAPELKPEVRPKPKPKPAVKKPIPRPESTPEAVPAPAKAVSGSAVSMPGAGGNVAAESRRSSEVLAAILQIVEKHKRYPRQGRRSGAEGTCTLAVQIGADGRVFSCTLFESSGRSVLDAASKKLGEKLLNLNVGSPGSLKVLVPVHYRLTDR